MIDQMAHSQKGLAFRVLMNEKINNTSLQILQVVIQQVVADEAHMLFSMFFQEVGCKGGTFGSGNQYSFKIILFDKLCQLLLESVVFWI